MQKNKKFNPRINEVKLDYTQAVLACSCFNTGKMRVQSGPVLPSGTLVCHHRIQKAHETWYQLLTIHLAVS